jgi:hypothetical protein
MQRKRRNPTIIGTLENNSIISRPMAETVMKQSRETSLKAIPDYY